MHPDPISHHLPSETALFLSGYGTRFSPAYLGNWIKKLLKRCGIDKPGSCHLWRHSCATDMHRGGADIRYVQEMLGHARMETTQIYTHVHIEALREIHARCHPHGRLDATHDIYGQLTKPDKPEIQDLPSRDAEETLQIEFNMVAAASYPIARTAPVTAVDQARTDLPPDEEPPIGGAPVTAPKPPTKGGPPAWNPLVPDFGTAAESPESQGLKPRVAYYTYRYYDPLTGRWLSKDPVEEEGGTNLYGFVNNCSVSNIDVNGHKIYTKEDEAYREQVKNSLEKLTGSVLEWKKTDGNLHYLLCEKKEGATELASTLSRGINEDSRITIIDGNLLEDAMLRTIGKPPTELKEVHINRNAKLVLRVNVPGTPNALNKNVKDFASLEARWDVLLWHELAGHAILGLTHPDEDWNYWNKGFLKEPPAGYGTQVDPVIAEENKARAIFKDVARAPFYYGWKVPW